MFHLSLTIVVHLLWLESFELLEQLSQHQEAAYERLYRWVQERCQTLEEETPAADVTLQVNKLTIYI